jgi:hypothetical protein
MPAKKPSKGKGAAVMGRPTIWTQQIEDDICKLLRAGSYVETAVEMGGISKVTFYSWCKQAKKGDSVYIDFLNAVKRAVAEGETRDLLRIDAFGAENWQAIAWKLERRMPHKWGRRDREVVHRDEIPEDATAAFDPSLLSIPELKQLSELSQQVEELHKKGLPADVLEAEFTVISDKATSNGKGNVNGKK